MAGTSNSSSRDNRITLVAAASFAVGVVAASVIFRHREKKRRKINRLNGESSRVESSDVKGINSSYYGKEFGRTQLTSLRTIYLYLIICISLSAGATVEGNDLSLFYSSDIKALTTTTEEQKLLPPEIYGHLVRSSVICCVDVCVVRSSPITGEKECLLVERSSEPVRGVWWLPGGRMFRGETFFDTAMRKTREETGLSGARPIQILGFWNTFFPTSNWDTEEQQGTQTVQTVVLVELTEGSEVLLDDSSERYRWVSLDPDLALKNEEDKYVVEVLRRLKAWNLAS